MCSKRKVLVLGSPLDYVDQDYYDAFTLDYHVDVSLVTSRAKQHRGITQSQILYAKDRAETKAQLATKVAQDGPYEALVIKMGTIPYEPYDEDLLKGLGPECKIIVSASAGYNEFNIDWMTSAGIWFCNTVDAVSESTADMALFLVLAVLRNTSAAEKQAREGKWKTGLPPTADPSGKILGIVGLGSIGKYLAKKAKMFNMKIYYYNRRRLSQEDEKTYDAMYCPDLHSLLASSDVVSLHTPLNAGTTNLISDKEFAAMKDGSYLVNTARGAIVDEKALIQALDNGKVLRAGLDVFPHEPKINNFFTKSDKVILQPHMGGLTESSFAKSQQECLENIRAYFETGMPNSPVNDPTHRSV